MRNLRGFALNLHIRSFASRIGPNVMDAALQAAIQYHGDKKANDTQIQKIADLFLQAALTKTLKERKLGELTAAQKKEIFEGLDADQKKSVIQELTQYTRQTRVLNPGEEIPTSEIRRLQRLDDPTSLVHGSGGFLIFRVTDEQNSQYLLGANTFRGLSFVFGGAVDPAEKTYAQAAKRELLEELYFNLTSLQEKELDKTLHKWFQNVTDKDDIIKDAKDKIKALRENKLFGKVGEEIKTLEKCPAGILSKTDPKEDLGKNNQSYVRATFCPNTIDTTQPELCKLIKEMSAVAEIFGSHMNKLASTLPMERINQDYSGLPDVGEAKEYLLFKKDGLNINLQPLTVKDNKLIPATDLRDDKLGSLGFSVRMFDSAMQAEKANNISGARVLNDILNRNANQFFGNLGSNSKNPY